MNDEQGSSNLDEAAQNPLAFFDNIMSKIELEEFGFTA